MSKAEEGNMFDKITEEMKEKGRVPALIISNIIGKNFVGHYSKPTIENDCKAMPKERESNDNVRRRQDRKHGLDELFNVGQDKK